MKVGNVNGRGRTDNLFGLDFVGLLRGTAYMVSLPGLHLELHLSSSAAVGCRLSLDIFSKDGLIDCM